jgi:hypothetical protein
MKAPHAPQGIETGVVPAIDAGGATIDERPSVGGMVDLDAHPSTDGRSPRGPAPPSLALVLQVVSDRRGEFKAVSSA